MSLMPAPGGARHPWAHAWETIRYVLDSNPRTARLCVILLVIGLTSTAPVLIMMLAHHLIG